MYFDAYLQLNRTCVLLSTYNKSELWHGGFELVIEFRCKE